MVDDAIDGTSEVGSGVLSRAPDVVSRALPRRVEGGRVSTNRARAKYYAQRRYQKAIDEALLEVEKITPEIEKQILDMIMQASE